MNSDTYPTSHFKPPSSPISWVGLHTWIQCRSPDAVKSCWCNDIIKNLCRQSEETAVTPVKSLDISVFWIPKPYHPCTDICLVSLTSAQSPSAIFGALTFDRHFRTFIAFNGLLTMIASLILKFYPGFQYWIITESFRIYLNNFSDECPSFRQNLMNICWLIIQHLCQRRLNSDWVNTCGIFTL